MERLVKGDIIIIDFPYSDLVHYKKRPALVLKVPKGEDILACQITGNSSEKNVEVPIDLKDFREGSLKRSSFLRIDKIFSIEKTMINYKICSLKSEKFLEIINKICDYLRD